MSSSPTCKPPISLYILIRHTQVHVLTNYSWLTAFIFAAQDYDWHSCYAHAPPGVTCTRKRANQAFMFLTLYVVPHHVPLHESVPVLPVPLNEMCRSNRLLLASLLSSACSLRSFLTVRRRRRVWLLRRRMGRGLLLMRLWRLVVRLRFSLNRVCTVQCLD